MYKALVVDLDGTLLTSERTISERNQTALNRAREQGVRIVLCSGRSHRSMRRFVEQLNYRNEGDYYISFHGGMIVDAKANQPVRIKYIDRKILEWFVRTGRKYSDILNVQLYRGEMFYVERRDETTERYEKTTLSPKGVLVPDLIEWIDDTVMKALFISRKPDILLAMMPEFKKTMPEGMRLISSNPYLLEYSDETINKGEAVRYTMSLQGIPLDQVICMGDSYNDIPMLKEAGLGVAVRNGEAEVRQVADFITDGTNDEDAVAEVVERFILGERS